MKIVYVFFLMSLITVICEWKRYSYYGTKSSDEEVATFNKLFKEELSKIDLNLFEQSKNAPRPLSNIHIMIITKVRRGLTEKEQYFHLTLQSILRSMMRENVHNISLSVCDINEEEERYLSLWSHLAVPIVKRPKSLTNKNIINQETIHYLWCLKERTKLNVSHSDILLLEDDVVLEENRFFSVLFNSRKYLSNNKEYVIKLYHPPRLLGFLQPEIPRILELIALGILFHYIFLILFVYKTNSFLKYSKMYKLMLFLIWIEIVLIIGRWRILYVRSFHKDLHLLVPSPFCCTPGTLFSNNSLKKIFQHFDSIQYDENFIKGETEVPIDDLLYKFVKKYSIPFYYIEPNIIKHIGHISTIRENTVDPKVL